MFFCWVEHMEIERVAGISTWKQTSLWQMPCTFHSRSGPFMLVFPQINFSITTSSSRASGGLEVSEEKRTIWQRKNLPIECAQGDRPARCPNHFFAVNKPSAVPWWWCDLFWCHEVACGVRWSNVVGCEVTWGELLWLVATWHVMSCHLMWWSCHLMRCDCLCCVMSRDAMRCHVMCAHVMSCHLLCPAMGWNVMSLRRHRLWGHIVWFEVVLCQCGDPKVLFCTTKHYSSTTGYKVLLQYYSVLQGTTPVLQSITLYYKVLLQYYSVLQTYYSSTTPYYKVLLQYYKVLLQYYFVRKVLLQYYSSTPYYKVLLQTTLYCKVLSTTTPVLLCTLLQYYPVLQSTTPVLRCTTKY